MSAISVSMPPLGESVSEWAITSWLKNEGERVKVDEPLIVVSTGEVDTVIRSPASGILRGITVAEDETVAVGAYLAIIDEDLEHARNLPVDIGPGRPNDAREQRGTGRVAPSAARLLGTAVRSLPAADRDRYAEEFRSELWEIAHIGGHRWAQLAYAARTIVSVRRLRAELQVPRRGGAAP